MNSYFPEPAPLTSAEIGNRPKQERSRRTREKIIEAALKLFDERGFEKTTSNDIALAAGVSIGSFYVYFTDKRQVLLLVLERLLSERIDAVFSNFQADDHTLPSLRKQIRQAVARAFYNKCLTPGLTRVIQELAGKDEEIAQLRKKFVEKSIHQLRDILATCEHQGLTNQVDVNIASRVINHAVDAVAYEYMLSGNRSEEEKHVLIEELTDMIFRYVFKPIKENEE